MSPLERRFDPMTHRTWVKTGDRDPFVVISADLDDGLQLSLVEPPQTVREVHADYWLQWEPVDA